MIFLKLKYCHAVNVIPYDKWEIKHDIIRKASIDDENSLKKAAHQLGRSKSDLAQAERTPYSMGIDLFDVGKLASPPSDPLKKQLWEKLRAKQKHMD